MTKTGRGEHNPVSYLPRKVDTGAVHRVEEQLSPGGKPVEVPKVGERRHTMGRRPAVTKQHIVTKLTRHCRHRHRRSRSPWRQNQGRALRRKAAVKCTPGQHQRLVELWDTVEVAQMRPREDLERGGRDCCPEEVGHKRCPRGRRASKPHDPLGMQGPDRVLDGNNTKSGKNDTIRVPESCNPGLRRLSLNQAKKKGGGGLSVLRPLNTGPDF